MDHHGSDMAAILGGGIGLGVGIVFFLVNILFIWSIYKTLRQIPDDKQRFPAWLCWLMIIPLAGFVISWIVMPFAVPAAIKAVGAGNDMLQKAGKSLFGIGLAYMIVITCSFIIPFVIIITGIVAVILWIIYWVKVVNVRKMLPHTV